MFTIEVTAGVVYTVGVITGAIAMLIALCVIAAIKSKH